MTDLPRTALSDTALSDTALSATEPEAAAAVWADLARYAATPRTVGLALSADGTRLVATVQAPDKDGARYRGALWEIPLEGGDPARLTRSEKGESAPAFLPDGTLLFVSSRPTGADENDDRADEAALWALPPHGDPYVVSRRPGGLSDPVVATESGDVVLHGSRLLHSTDADDEERRKLRKDRKINAILHTGMPIRYWDHELGDSAPRLLRLAGKQSGAAGDGYAAREIVDLVPDVTDELVETSVSVSADGSIVATGWRVHESGGRSASAVAVLDVSSGDRRLVPAAPDEQLSTPVVSPDGRLVAVGMQVDADYEKPFDHRLIIWPTRGGEQVEVKLGDLFATEWVWSPDSGTLYVAGDLGGRGAVLAIDAATGQVLRRLANDAVYSSLCPAPDGSMIYALRSAIDAPPAPVRLLTAGEDQQPQYLPDPAPVLPLPGELLELSAAAAGGATVHGWVCRPPLSGGLSPVMLWIHGGPLGSWNSWSWRWNPWVAVAHGWTVVLPDPALSTGYGPNWLARAWPYVAAEVFADCEALLGEALTLPGVDADRVACLGASFGGYMTNWVAGHTDRFGAIVTHAGLWALDQQHATTDMAWYKTSIFGRLEDHPEWYAANSPHNAADDITTPMLVIHGNRDYRVPVSEATRLWWDLVSRWDGAPEDLPHRFLQFTDENHWILSPANVEVWYDAVLGFCADHVLGQRWTPSPLVP